MSKRRYLLSSLALGALVAMPASAQAEARQIQQYDIPAQELGGALRAFARTSGVQVIFDGKAVRGKRSEALRYRAGAEEALREAKEAGDHHLVDDAAKLLADMVAMGDRIGISS